MRSSSRTSTPHSPHSARGTIQQRHMLESLLSSTKSTTKSSTNKSTKASARRRNKSKGRTNDSHDNIKSSKHKPHSTAVANYFNNVTFYVLPVLLWLAVATTFYTIHNEWTASESFYYAVQSGLSIGFGVIPETDDVSRLFTTFHVLCGALGMTVMLSLLAEAALANIETKVRMESLSKLLLHDRHNNNNKNNSDAAEIKDMHRSTLCAQLLSGVVSVEVLGAVVWLSIGSYCGYVYQEFTIIQSIYFAVTAASTGGLEGVERTDLSLFWAALYCLIGVPLFGIATSKIATIWLESRTVEKVRERVRHESMNQEEWMKYALSLDFVTAESSRDDGNVHQQRAMDLSEYLCMELTSLGLVQKDHLKVIVERFMELDADHSGDITLDEAKASRMVVGSRAGSEEDNDGDDGDIDQQKKEL